MKHYTQAWLGGLKHRVVFTLLTLSTVVGTLILSPAVSAQTQQVNQAYKLSEAELAQTLAPIALYPDSLLTHILISATYPLQVVEADRWLTKHSTLSAQQLQYKAEDKEWDASVKALAAFPHIIKKLSDELAWTQTLGSAFLQDEERVLDSIQTLRHRAQEAGNLDKIKHVNVITEQRHIVIESANPSVIYVPYYDTRVVYGHWHWRHYPPTFWAKPVFSIHHPSHFHWGVGIHISNHFFFSAFHWQSRHIVINHQQRYGYVPRKRIVSSHHGKRWSHQGKGHYKHHRKAPIKTQRVIHSPKKVSHKYGRSPANTHYKATKQAIKQRSHGAKHVVTKQHKVTKHKVATHNNVNRYVAKNKRVEKNTYSSRQKSTWKANSNTKHKQSNTLKIVNKRVEKPAHRVKH